MWQGFLLSFFERGDLAPYRWSLFIILVPLETKALVPLCLLIRLERVFSHFLFSCARPFLYLVCLPIQRMAWSYVSMPERVVPNVCWVLLQSGSRAGRVWGAPFVFAVLLRGPIKRLIAMELAFIGSCIWSSLWSVYHQSPLLGKHPSPDTHWLSSLPNNTNNSFSNLLQPWNTNRSWSTLWFPYRKNSLETHYFPSNHDSQDLSLGLVAASQPHPMTKDSLVLQMSLAMGFLVQGTMSIHQGACLLWDHPEKTFVGKSLWVLCWTIFEGTSPLTNIDFVTFFSKESVVESQFSSGNCVS